MRERACQVSSVKFQAGGSLGRGALRALRVLRGLTAKVLLGRLVHRVFNHEVHEGHEGARGSCGLWSRLVAVLGLLWFSVGLSDASECARVKMEIGGSFKCQVSSFKVGSFNHWGMT